ncbi:MAG: GerAB/ArcD/ProY family transporter [Tumebacillaceae bacterium]
MQENGIIGVRQFTVLVILFTIGSSILIVPSALAAEAQQDAWLGAIVGVGVGTCLVFLYNTIGMRFPGMTMVQLSEFVLGKWLGKAVALLFVAHFFLLATLVLRNIGDFITTNVMTDTPIQIIHTVFVLVVIMGIGLGLETLARASEILFPWVILLFFILTIFLLKEVHIEKILPIYENGFKPVARAGLTLIGTPFLELVSFLMIFPYVKKRQGATGAFLVGSLVGGSILIILSLITILVLGADITARNNYPSYALAKKISVGNFLERVEAMMAGIWFISIFMKVAICFYASALGLSQVLGMKQYRTLLLPMGMIMVTLSLVVFPSIVYFKEFVTNSWAPYSATFGLVLPVLLLVIGLFRKKRTMKG